MKDKPNRYLGSDTNIIIVIYNTHIFMLKITEGTEQLSGCISGSGMQSATCK